MRKYFTKQDANDALVLVKPIVKDILKKRKEFIRVKRLLQTDNIALIWLTEQLKEARVARLVSELKDLSGEISQHLDELEQIGCYLKDFEKGRIDFPSVLKGRVVFLTWEYKEKEVSFWKELTKEELFPIM